MSGVAEEAPCSPPVQEEEGEMRLPHINDDRDKCFFQTDAELEKMEERCKRVNYTKGEAIKLPSKILDLKIQPEKEEESGSTPPSSSSPGYVYVAGAGFTARKVNLDTGKTAKIYKGHQAPVTSVAVCRSTKEEEGEVLFTGSWDKSIIKWDTKSKEVLAVLSGHTDFVKCLAVTKDGRYLFSGSSDATIRQWDLSCSSSPVCCAVFKAHTRGVETLHVDEENGHVYSGSSDAKVMKWAYINEDDDAHASASSCAGAAAVITEALLSYEGHETSVYGLDVDGQSGWAYSGSADGTVHRWDVESGACDCVYPHEDWVKTVRVVGGDTLVTGSRDEKIRVFDVGSGGAGPRRVIEGHFDEVGCVQVLGKAGMIISGSLDGTVRRWPLHEEDDEKAEEEEEEDELAAFDKEIEELNAEMERVAAGEVGGE
eukprot:Nk52_evm1s1626 gene=Nk52_evmTU1s1626